MGHGFWRLCTASRKTAVTPPSDDATRRHWRTSQRIAALWLAVWVGVTFGITYFARELNGSLFGWPFSFWVAAQGALLVYLALVVLHARWMNRLDARLGAAEPD